MSLKTYKFHKNMQQGYKQSLVVHVPNSYSLLRLYWTGLSLIGARSSDFGARGSEIGERKTELGARCPGALPY